MPLMHFIYFFCLYFSVSKVRTRCRKDIPCFKVFFFKLVYAKNKGDLVCHLWTSNFLSSLPVCSTRVHTLLFWVTWLACKTLSISPHPTFLRVRWFISMIWLFCTVFHMTVCHAWNPLAHNCIHKCSVPTRCPIWNIKYLVKERRKGKGKWLLYAQCTHAEAYKGRLVTSDWHQRTSWWLWGTKYGNCPIKVSKQLPLDCPTR
jgi:hypothetical protein